MSRVISSTKGDAPTEVDWPAAYGTREVVITLFPRSFDDAQFFAFWEWLRLSKKPVYLLTLETEEFPPGTFDGIVVRGNAVFRNKAEMVAFIQHSFGRRAEDYDA
jgi:hypothetical protein